MSINPRIQSTECPIPVRNALHLHYNQWRTGPPGNREISRWAPASWSFSGPRLYSVQCSRKFISFIISWHSRQTWLSIQRTGHDVRFVSPSESEWTNDGDVSYSFTCRLPPTRIKTIFDENKKPSCRFFEHNCRAGLTIRGPVPRQGGPLPFFSFPPFRGRPLKYS